MNETLPSSEKLMKDLISTLEKEITDLEKALTEISFIIKAKKAKLRKYKALDEHTPTETTLDKDNPAKQ